MKLYDEIYESVLCDEAIDECSKRVRGFLQSVKQPRSEVLRYALSIEEILIKIREQDPNNEKHISLTMGKKFFKTFIELVVDGESINVYLEDDNHSALGDYMLKTIGLSPEYVYKNLKNVYSFRIKKKRINPLIKLAIAFAAAFLIGMVGGALLSGATRTACVDAVLIPLHDTFLNVLGAIAGPMIFLSVAWGIYGIGDASTLKQIGSKLLGSYIAVLFAGSTVLGIASLPLFGVSLTKSSGAGSGLAEIFTMILGIIPPNIFSPFIDGNTLQIIFLGVLFGIAMLFLGRRTEIVAQLIEQINLIVQFLIEIISVLVPYFIFIVLIEMQWSDTIGVMKKVARLFAVFAVAVVAFASFMLIYTSIRNRVSPIMLFTKQFPTLITGITTASSAACFGINLKSCRNNLGINEKITSFGLPLGMVAFKTNTSLNYVTMAIFFAKMYDVDVSVQWIIIMLFTAGVLAIATPPIPGGAASSYTVLFLQLGIPAEAVAIALACDAIFDFMATGADQFLMPFQLLNQASKLGLVDRKTLLSK